MEHQSSTVNNPKLTDFSPVTISVLNSIHSTVCRYHQFAKALDVSEDVVRGWVNNGYLPTLSLGKYAMINLVRYRADLLAGSVPASYK
jgi:hypothetical protein